MVDCALRPAGARGVGSDWVNQVVIQEGVLSSEDLLVVKTLISMARLLGYPRRIYHLVDFLDLILGFENEMTCGWGGSSLGFIYLITYYIHWCSWPSKCFF